MAQSRLERIGTIFSRVASLMKGGAMKPEDKPIWYDVYEAFPPKVEPRYDRPVPHNPIRKIFYKEDIIRAEFQKKNRKILACSLVSQHESRTQQFIKVYQELEKTGVPKENLFSEAMEKYLAMNQAIRDQLAKKKTNDEDKDDQDNTRESKQSSTKQEIANVDLKDIFKE